MAHFAQLDATLTVTSVVVVSDELDGKELDLCASSGRTYRQCSYNTRGGVHASGDQSKAYRKNYPSQGYTYDIQRDAFIPPRPYQSWTLNETTCQWEPPSTMPDDGKLYEWQESNTSWVEYTKPTD